MQIDRLDDTLRRIRSDTEDNLPMYRIRNHVKYDLNLDDDASQQTLKEIKLILQQQKHEHYQR